MFFVPQIKVLACLSFEFLSFFHYKWCPPWGKGVKFKNEHHEFQMGYQEVFRRQKYWVVEGEDVSNLNLTNVCESIKGKHNDVCKPNTC